MCSRTERERQRYESTNWFSVSSQSYRVVGFLFAVACLMLRRRPKKMMMFEQKR